MCATYLVGARLRAKLWTSLAQISTLPLPGYATIACYSTFLSIISHLYSGDNITDLIEL